MVQLVSCLAFALALSVQIVFGQSTREKVRQSAQWFAVTANIKMTKKLSMMVEGQFRQADNFVPQQYQLRGGLDINLNRYFSIVPLGYVYTWNHKYGKQPAAFANNEHRIWQQVSFKHGVGKLQVDHRLRLEERFIESHITGSDGRIVNEGYVNRQARLRYKLGARLPLNTTTIGAGSYFLSVYDELFVSRGKHVTYRDPDQNRIFAGIGYQVDKNLTVQAGAFNQMLIKKNGAQQEDNFGFQFQLTYNIDCTGKSE